MRAVRLVGPHSAEVVSVPDLQPGPGEVLVRVLACGVCGSDLNAWRGVPGVVHPLPAGAPGHEVYGRVTALGDQVQGLAVGERVAGLFQNGYAEQVLARAEQVLPLPAEAPEPFLGEPVACAMNVVRRTQVRRGDRVALVGFGYLAALVAQLLGAAGQVEWMAISQRAESRQLAHQLGASATYGFDAFPSELADAFPVVIEAAGVQRALDYATGLVATRGRLVIAGYHADGPRTVNMQSWNWKGLDVINAHERNAGVYMEGMRLGLDQVIRQRLDPAALISHRWPLADAAQALATAAERPSSYVKGIVVP